VNTHAPTVARKGALQWPIKVSAGTAIAGRPKLFADVVRGCQLAVCDAGLREPLTKNETISRTIPTHSR